MFTLLFLLALKVTVPAEMACVGTIQDLVIPMDLYISAVQEEGTKTFASEGNIVYLNGPGTAGLKIGDIRRVVRPEGTVRDPSTKALLGTYYKDIGTIRIEAVEKKNATARVLLSCQAMQKGDLIVADAKKSALEFDDKVSNAVTQLPQDGVVGSIVLGRDDVKEIGAGHFCFITLGQRDGIGIGDRLTVFRAFPEFSSRDLEIAGEGTNVSYTPFRDRIYKYRLSQLLGVRSIPPMILGDIIVVEAGDDVATGKVINSLQEIHPGDFVVKR